jgi:hypothetical protein
LQVDADALLASIEGQRHSRIAAITIHRP